MCRWAIRRWAATPASRSAWRWRSRTDGGAVRFRGRHPDEPRHARRRSPSRRRRISIISCSTTSAMRRPADSRCRTRRLSPMTCWRAAPAIRAPSPSPNWRNSASSLPGILAQPGPVFVALKVLPEVENTPIGRRSRWQTRTRDKVVQDLRMELGAWGSSMTQISRRGVLALGGAAALAPTARAEAGKTLRHRQQQRLRHARSACGVRHRPHRLATEHVRLPGALGGQSARS